MPKRVFLSLPFAGRTDEEVSEEMREMVDKYLFVNNVDPNDVSFVTTYFCPKEIDEKAKATKHPNLVYMSYAFEVMSQCDDVIFSKNWKDARGCQVEHLAYELYMGGKA